MLTGIIAISLGTILQALTYCLVKENGRSGQMSTLRILMCAHLIMGLTCSIPFIYFKVWNLLTVEVVLYAAAVNITYLLAQFFMFSAITRSDPSISSPYLILKLPLVALLSIIIFGEHLTLIQAFALFGIVILSLIYSKAVKINFGVLLLVLSSALCFALCDVFVMYTARALDVTSAVWRSVFTVVSCDVQYLLFAPVLLLMRDRPHLKQFASVLPLSISWQSGVTFTIIGFNIAGVISSNIVLSMRALVAVALTAMFFRWQLSGEGRFKTKSAAALGMCACVAFYYNFA